MKRNILVLGYFGLRNNQLDGQTIKTRNVYELIKLKITDDYCLTYFDTQDFKFERLSIFKMLSKLYTCDTLLYLPAQNNLNYIFPFVYFLSFVRKFDILYIVIGGWLSEFLKKKWLHRILLSHIKGVFLENLSVKKQLQQCFNYKNTHVLSNFRIYDFTPIISSNEDKFHIVFMSRIVMEKGLDIIFSIADKLAENKTLPKVLIDFYGQIDNKDKAYFENSLQKYDFISYKGELQPDEIHKILSEYDLLILPTRYKGEGFPGAILDAYISGIPVLVSDWKYNKEFVNDGITGYICDGNSPDHFYEKILTLYKDASLLYNMKQAAYEKSKEYNIDCIWNLLKHYIIKD